MEKNHTIEEIKEKIEYDGRMASIRIAFFPKGEETGEVRQLPIMISGRDDDIAAKKLDELLNKTIEKGTLKITAPDMAPREETLWYYQLVSPDNPATMIEIKGLKEMLVNDFIKP